MSTVKIPAKIEVYCDICSALTHNFSGNGGRKQDGVLTIERTAIDMHGYAAAGGSVTYDLCDDCLALITEAILSVAEKVHAKKVQAENVASDKTDMTGTNCSRCKKGKYIETSIHDDWDGVLHCDKCSHEIKG